MPCIAMSFIINIDIEDYDEQDVPGYALQGELQVVQNEAVFHAQAVTGTQTGLMGMFKAIQPKQLVSSTNPLS